jgi:hypothetical protein
MIAHSLGSCLCALKCELLYSNCFYSGTLSNEKDNEQGEQFNSVTHGVSSCKACKN